MNTLLGGDGNDLILLKEASSLVNSDGSFRFGPQTISGGQGRDTLRFVINDQNPVAEQDFIAEFKTIEAAFDQSKLTRHPGNFTVNGLHVVGVEALQLQVDSVSTDPTEPYLITHSIALSNGRASPAAAALVACSRRRKTGTCSRFEADAAAPASPRSARIVHRQA